jgi:amidophosphoribosyltransferase
MGGFFGVASKTECISDLFFGTDYHSHLGTSRGGMAVWNGSGFSKAIHNIENTQFRSKFDSDIEKFKGNTGIGCISDWEPQPLTVRSHLGQYAITTVGKINNIDEIIDNLFKSNSTHFLEISKGEINPTELVATIIAQESTLIDGIRKAQELIDGSCSMLIALSDGIIAARDRLGRTPIIIGEKDGAVCAASEPCSMMNLGYNVSHELGPAEIVKITTEGIEKILPPGKEMKMCAFLWVYYGYPASTYEGRNVEDMRYSCGAALARNDNEKVDIVAGVPDSGTAHAIGYANESEQTYGRPFVKYTPTWPRSFMPQNQNIRDLVARMKLIPIEELVKGKKLLFCEDSIVRGTQLRETVERLYKQGAKEIHMRPACPPLVYGCKFLNFSRSKSEMDLATRQAIRELEGEEFTNFEEYTDTNSEKYSCMIEWIRKKLNLTSLKYQKLDDMLDAIGLPKEKICTYCWNAKG